jgi:prolyl oligopeptidase
MVHYNKNFDLKMKNRLLYPHTRKADTVDDYHGVKVADPYRWLEDVDSTETRAWIEEQNKLTSSYLQQIPARKKIYDRLKRLWDYEKYGVPHKEGKRFFFLKNDGLQNQFVLYTMTSLDAKPAVLLDPNRLSADGTISLASYCISDDGELMAYGLSTAGSDWMEWRVRDVATAKDHPDVLKWIKFSGASWTTDRQGFFYSRYDEPSLDDAFERTNYFHKLCYHQLGTSQAEDLLIYERPDQKEWHFDGRVTEDGRYLVITVWKGTAPLNLVFYKDLFDPEVPILELVSEFKAEYQLIANEGPVFFFKTNHEAPRGRVIAMNVANPASEKVLIPELPETLEGAAMIGGHFLCTYLKDAHSQVKIYDASGKFVREISLPEIGTVYGFTGKKEDQETFYGFSSFSYPPTIYRYEIPAAKTNVFRKPKVDFDPEKYETTQIYYQSKDGTRIPMFLSHKKGLKPTPQTPVYLYGYGGFNHSLTPFFGVSTLVWMELGCILAVPNIRGGGEYGEEWHQAGTGRRKQNVFDDFIAAAEWLIQQKYTSSSRLMIGGGSNGGLLVAACMIQRPDLFAAALPSVGVFDMLRFHKFTIGWAWIDDYGTPEDPQDFEALYAYSPLHNLKPETAYPATLITTADHDDRVVPAHSFKFAAALQAAQAGPAPVLIRVDVRAGHGGGKPTAKVIDEVADKWAFLISIIVD